VTQVLIVLAFLFGYAVFVLVKPEKDCRKCSGWGQGTRRRRTSACGRCKGTGKQFRLGARLVHGGVVLAVKSARDWLERRREAD
jgi:DnaJ-class molecular chaperone